MKAADIAKVCHEANKAYCESLGDLSQKHWDDAPDWQKESAISGVNFHLLNPGAIPSQSHDNWLQEKLDAGWSYGDVKDEAKKEHPCIMPYGQLPEEQRKKDVLFIAIVNALKEVTK